MTKFVRWAGLLPTVTIGQGCSWEVTTNDEIGDATIKVSVMMLIMMKMMIMIMMMMAMLVMICWRCWWWQWWRYVTHSPTHSVTLSHGHTDTGSLTRSLIHPSIHSFVHSLLIYTFPRSCIQWCRLPTINVKIVHWERPISQRALRWLGRCPRCHQRGRRRLLSTPCHTLTCSTVKVVHADWVTWSMSSAWSTLRVVSVIVRLPQINVFDVVVVVVVVVVD